MFRKSKDYYELAKDLPGYARALRNIAHVHSKKQENSNAEWYYKEALLMCRRLGYQELANSVASELGCVYFEMGRREQPQEILAEALKNNPQASNALLCMGRIFLWRGDWEHARHYFQKTIRCGDVHEQCLAHRLLMEMEEKYKYSLACIEANEQKLKELERDLAEAVADKDLLQSQLLLSQKELLELSNRQNHAFRDIQELQEAAFRQSDIYILFHKAGCEETPKVTEAQWTELRTAIDTTYANFTDRLYALYPKLSGQELRICYLVKTGISVRGMAQLLNRSKAAITVARCRLYKKIHGTEGNGEIFDHFIAEF